MCVCVCVCVCVCACLPLYLPLPLTNPSTTSTTTTTTTTRAHVDEIGRLEENVRDLEHRLEYVHVYAYTCLSVSLSYTH